MRFAQKVRDLLSREVGYAKEPTKALLGGVGCLIAFGVVAIGAILLLATLADWSEAGWAQLKAANAEHDQKATIRREHDKAMQKKCVGAELLSPECVEWAK